MEWRDVFNGELLYSVKGVSCVIGNGWMAGMGHQEIRLVVCVEPVAYSLIWPTFRVGALGWRWEGLEPTEQNWGFRMCPCVFEECGRVCGNQLSGFSGVGDINELWTMVVEGILELTGFGIWSAAGIGFGQGRGSTWYTLKGKRNEVQFGACSSSDVSFVFWVLWPVW